MTAIRHTTPAAGHPDIDIQYLRRREIDPARWDRCIRDSHSPLIYGQSDYLDAMTEGQWDALVLGDYRAVMPLTWRSRYTVRYLYQPAFTQQTGIFSTIPHGAAAASTAADPISADLTYTDPTAAFLAQVDRHFRFAEIYLNYTNPHPGCSPRTNYILPLNNTYEAIAGQYRKDLNRNLKLAGRTPLSYLSDYDVVTALHDFRREYATRLPAIKENDYSNFETLCLRLHRQGQLLTRTVMDDRHQIMCSSVFLKDSRRFYLIHSTTLPAGRATEANHFLLDQFIREWAGSPMILDFEGSDHPGISHFYANFGAIDQPYFFYRRNRLPWPLRWLK
jgi:hypothetical protein